MRTVALALLLGTGLLPLAAADGPTLTPAPPPNLVTITLTDPCGSNAPPFDSPEGQDVCDHLARILSLVPGRDDLVTVTVNAPNCDPNTPVYIDPYQGQSWLCVSGHPAAKISLRIEVPSPDPESIWTIVVFTPCDEMVVNTCLS